MISTITSGCGRLLAAALAILILSSNRISTATALDENEETDDINNNIQRHRQSRRVIPPPYHPSKIKTTTEDHYSVEEAEGEVEEEETLVNVFQVDFNKDKLPGVTGGIFYNNNDEEKEELNEIIPYIVGGNDVVTPRKYPYFVHLGGCGGSLIRPNIVLSAAHCEGISDTVTLGLHKIQLTNFETEEFNNIEHIKIVESVIHPNYNENTLDNDYWLIRLEKDSRYPIVELDTPDDDLNLIDNVELVVFGFGTTQQGGYQPNTIQEVTVDYKSNDNCGNYGRNDLTDNMLCAGRQGKDSCQGDSGGPIIHKITGKQVGVVSWGYGCANPRYPGIYARVSSQYDEFIQPYIDQWTDPVYLAANAIPTDPIYNTCADSFNGGFYDKDGRDYNCLWYGTSVGYCARYGGRGHGGSNANEACCACGGGVPTSGETPTPPPTPAPTPRPTRDRTTNCPQNRGLGSSLSATKTTTKDRAFGAGGGGNRPGKCRPNAFGGERAQRRCRCRNGLDP